MRIDWKDLGERALWTFVEAFLVALPATITMDLSGAEWKAVLLSAAAAGLSAVKGLIIEWVKAAKAKEQQRIDEEINSEE